MTHNNLKGVNPFGLQEVTMATTLFGVGSFAIPIVWILLSLIVSILILVLVVYVVVRVAKYAWCYNPASIKTSYVPTETSNQPTSSDAKFCLKCGTKIPKMSEFCPSCGTKQILA